MLYLELMRAISLRLFVFLISLQSAFAQQVWIPTEKDIRGRGWDTGYAARYDRLPASAEQKVRKEVWNLSRQSSGLHLDFLTNARSITVRYIVSGNVQMPHMPATGVSGLDLYVHAQDGGWRWTSGRFQFGDTITYTYAGMNDSAENRDYVLYLPLYNQIKWLEVRYTEGSTLEVRPASEKRPIVVYGTSIAQGGCASRPGLAWTNILSRGVDIPVVNLGFSGNGRLEKPLFELISEVDASLYILDCLPNMASADYVKSGLLARRLDTAIQVLRGLRPDVPILFTAHAGYTDDENHLGRRNIVEQVNTVLYKFIDSIKRKGETKIYYLSRKNIGLDLESAVDGIHPNDAGMLQYGRAYTRKAKPIIRY